MKIKEKMYLGIEALKKNKYENAKIIFESILKEEPMNAETNHLLGISFQLLNKLDQAIIYYEKSIKIKPDFDEAHKNLGNMFYRLGKIYEAEKCYKNSLKINPKLAEAKINLEIVLEQKKIDNWISQNQKSLKNNLKKNNINPYVTERKVETDLLDQLYKIQTIQLNETKDVRFGNGKCSSDMNLFESKNKIINSVANDIVNIVKDVIGSKIYIADSFFNILQSGSGTKPHKHLAPFDKRKGYDKQKYSLTYYVSVGDQTGKEPGKLKLYDPNEEILPSNGTMVIIPSSRTHSSSYDGNKDRVMIGANFYCLM